MFLRRFLLNGDSFPEDSVANFLQFTFNLSIEVSISRKASPASDVKDLEKSVLFATSPSLIEATA